MSSINPISTVSPTSLTTPSTTASASTGTNSLTDPNTFLKLLVAELKYQDPMNPTDPNTMLAQTAQFSVVEQLNNLTTQIAAMTTSSQDAAGAALIGRRVAGTDAAGDAVSGVVSGLQTSSSGMELLVGGQDVPLANVTSIADASAATTPSATTPAAGTTTTATTPSTAATTATTDPATSTTPAAAPSTASTSAPDPVTPAATAPTTEPA
jgi:flagellar basal-body rod modification protein FlgD